MTPRIRLNPILIGLAALALTACQSTLPYVRGDEPTPAPVVVADHSAERRALNEQVYDAATDWVGQLFYRPDFNGADWPTVAAQRREAVVAQPDEFAFYDSPSQFSREYTRLFGTPPARDAARLRAEGMLATAV